MSLGSIVKSKTHLLDDLTVRAARYGDKPNPLKDGDGLFLLVHANGSKYFQFRFSINGKPEKLQLGTYPKLSLKEARLKLVEFKDMVARGISPSIEKRKSKAVSKFNVGNTFQAVAEQWLQLKTDRVTPKYHVKVAGMLKANAYPRLGKLPISEITSPMILEALKVIEARGAYDLMNRVRALIGELFDYAKSVGLYEGENPTHCLKGTVALKKHKSQNYKTFVNSKDVGLFLRRLPEYSGTLEVQLLIKLQMMVATRPSEMRTATWDEFDFKSKLWTIKPERMKMGIEHVIPLPKQAIAALNQLKELTGYSKYLFPSHTTKGSLSEGTANKALKILWPEYLIHPHGFRHLFSTHANEHDYRWKDIVEAALAHKGTDRIRAVYNKATYVEERRKLAQWYADYLDDLKVKSVTQ